MNPDKKDFSNILFGFFECPLWGRIGESDGGFSVEIYAEGILVSKNYIFDNIEFCSSEYSISEEAISAIKEIMLAYDESIRRFDDCLDSDDGVANIFVFAGRPITIYNMEYLPVLKQQNEILTIFNKVTDVLKKEGIDLGLYGVMFHGDAIHCLRSDLPEELNELTSRFPDRVKTFTGRYDMTEEETREEFLESLLRDADNIHFSDSDADSDDMVYM